MSIVVFLMENSKWVPKPVISLGNNENSQNSNELYLTTTANDICIIGMHIIRINADYYVLLITYPPFINKWTRIDELRILYILK